jgi:hypothetical protein
MDRSRKTRPLMCRGGSYLGRDEETRGRPKAGLVPFPNSHPLLANSRVQQIASRVSIGCKHGAESGSPVQLQQRRTQTRASARGGSSRARPRSTGNAPGRLLPFRGGACAPLARQRGGRPRSRRSNARGPRRGRVPQARQGRCSGGWRRPRPRTPPAAGEERCPADRTRPPPAAGLRNVTASRHQQPTERHRFTCASTSRPRSRTSRDCRASGRRPPSARPSARGRWPRTIRPPPRAPRRGRERYSERHADPELRQGAAAASVT